MNVQAKIALYYKFTAQLKARKRHSQTSSSVEEAFTRPEGATRKWNHNEIRKIIV